MYSAWASWADDFLETPINKLYCLSKCRHTFRESVEMLILDSLIYKIYFIHIF